MLEALFIFDGKFYKQCDDVVMGFPLGTPLMCHFILMFLCVILKHLIGKLSPSFHFRSKDHAEQF